MKERPILFSAPMVRALLDGRKTQTRRVVKLPIIDKDFCCELSGGNLAASERDIWRHSPYGQPGDRLWVKETFSPNKVLPLCDRPAGEYIYRADLNAAGVTKWSAQWKPSIFCPRAASRIALDITAVRVERLQDITRDDAAAEGPPEIPLYQTPGQIEAMINGFGCASTLDYIGGYRQLWENINGSGSWAANPWVWVVEFKRL